MDDENTWTVGIKDLGWQEGAKTILVLKREEGDGKSCEFKITNISVRIPRDKPSLFKRFLSFFQKGVES